MRLFCKCQPCGKWRLFTKAWYYEHFQAGVIHDKQENPKCYWCYRKLQKALDQMKP